MPLDDAPGFSYSGKRRKIHPLQTGWPGAWCPHIQALASSPVTGALGEVPNVLSLSIL